MDGTESDSQEIRDNLLNHVILPRVLPQDKPPRFIESKLMMHVIETAVNSSNWLPQKTVEFCKRLKRVHLECTPQPDVVSAEINSLRSGDTFAMYVRRQNTVFMIYMLPNEDDGNNKNPPQSVIVSTFPGNLHPSEIYTAESDIEVIVRKK